MKWHPNTKLTTYTVLSQKKPYCQSLIPTHCHNQTKCQPLHSPSFRLLPFIELLEIKILLLYNIIPKKNAYSQNKKKCIKPVRLFYLFRRIKSKYTIGDDQYGTMHKEYTEKTHVGVREITMHWVFILFKIFLS